MATSNNDTKRTSTITWVSSPDVYFGDVLRVSRRDVRRFALHAGQLLWGGGVGLNSIPQLCRRTSGTFQEPIPAGAALNVGHRA